MGMIFLVRVNAMPTAGLAAATAAAEATLMAGDTLAVRLCADSSTGELLLLVELLLLWHLPVTLVG